MMRLKPIAANQTETQYDNGLTVFYSYSTPVAVFVPGKGAYCTSKKWSATTSRHVNKTLDRWGCSKHYVSPEQIEMLANAASPD